MFEELFLKVLDKHAPVKKKVVRENHARYISKLLRKAIMKKSYLEKVYFKNRQFNHWKQKNYYSRLYKNRKKFFHNLSTSFVNDNKLFWKTVKPFFSNNGSFDNKIKLVKNGELLEDDKNITEEMNNFLKMLFPF